MGANIISGDLFILWLLKSNSVQKASIIYTIVNKILSK